MRRLFILGLILCFVRVYAKDETKVFFNQVGYYPHQEKVLVVEGLQVNDKMKVTNADGQVVLTPTVTRTAVSPWSKRKRYIVDVSSIQRPGTYTLHCGRYNTDFRVVPQALHDVSVAALKLFYLIRSGVPVEKEYAGMYARPAGHPDTRVFIHPSAASVERPAGSIISSPLGWYDAGDYNKYIVNSAFSVAIMLQAYEQNKAYFSNLDTNIPESRNSTPDILDELMFNLRWMLTMQDPNDGGVYHKLTTPNFEDFIIPADCRQPRYVVAKSVTATLDFAAVMAQASRIMKVNRDYAEFSSQAEIAARQAYVWAKKHEQAFYSQEILNSNFQPAVVTGTYGDHQASDERFWAATELYLLTADEAYLKDVRSFMPERFNVPTWGNVAGLAAFSWLAAPDCDVRKTMLAQLKAYADATVAVVPFSCFQSSFGNQPRDFGWGCLAEGCCCSGVALLYADRYIDQGHYLHYALQNADYLMGRNATGYCFITGFGVKSPQHPHHRISASDGIDAPFPGMLVGGPNPGQQDRESGNLSYSSNYPDESYLDDVGSYASNEIAINWNASLVALLCWLDAELQ